MKFKLTRGMRLADVVQSQAISTDQCNIEILKDGSCAPFEEGVLISYFDSICRQFKNTNISISFDPLEVDNEILFSLLGLRLLSSASSLTIRQSRLTDGKELERVRAHIWGKVERNKGVIESGHHRYFVSRDSEYPMPQALSPALSGKFPTIEPFMRVLSEHIDSILGKSRTLEDDRLQSIGSFVYEAAKNAHEHGRHDEQKKAINGYRGIFLERLRTGSDGLLPVAGSVAAEVQDYIESFGNWAKGKNFVGITVVDAGLGIHKTIPLANKAEDTQAFQTAFWPGVSRKPPAELGVGLGLTNILRAVKQCSGYISVHSAGLLASRWYSNIPISLDDRVAFFPNVKKIGLDRGTALTLVFPVDKPSHK